MGSETIYLITARFAPWGYDKESPGESDNYPAFGVKYFIKISNDIVFKNSELEYWDKEQNIVDFFKLKFQEAIGREFDGEILFVEEQEHITIL